MVTVSLYSPVVCLDKEMQVVLIHVIQDVVAVCTNQVVVVLDFLLNQKRDKRYIKNPQK